MRRQDIQLLALARQGDSAACCEAGRRYLLGSDGFQRHVPTGIAYLSRAGVKALPQAARIIAESLPLDDIVQLQQDEALAQAAAAGSAAAQAKLGAWVCVRYRRLEEGARWLAQAAAGGLAPARQALAALRQAEAGETVHSVAVAGMLRALGNAALLDPPAVVLIAARQAASERDVVALAAAVCIGLVRDPHPTPELAELIAAAVRLAEEGAHPVPGIAAAAIEAALDQRVARGDRDAAYALGRALCGIAVGVMRADGLSTGTNMRKGVALLLRAADAGRTEAWLHLYRVHGDHRLSVANPQMARFCLEKAALSGQAEAQRKLGALLLRAADSLAESEQALHWLHLAACAKDAHAKRLLRSLVLPLAGRDDEALAAIDRVGQEDPWLATRLQLARCFGLTRLEALCVDPTQGLRPWGLVVGRNPFITQIRLAAARAIPALSDAAMQAARRAAAFFGQASGDALAFEGDLRRRTLRQRRVFERHGLDEAMFFANASSTTLQALRLGPKWAFRAKEPLQLALAA